MVCTFQEVLFLMIWVYQTLDLTTLNEVSYRAGQITKVTDLPTIVDADTGFDRLYKNYIYF